MPRRARFHLLTCLRAGLGYRRWPESKVVGMQVHDSLIELFGNTPLIRLRRVTSGLAPQVLAKVEYLNPGGSVKDRIALRMVEAAEASGALRPGGTIVEPTSGNTGIGLAIVAMEKGYRCLFVCPDKVAQDKISVLRAYGAEVVVCPTTVSPDHPDSYYSVSDLRRVTDAFSSARIRSPRTRSRSCALTAPRSWSARLRFRPITPTPITRCPI